MSDKIWLGQKAASLESAPSFDPYTGVTIWYDDENAYQAGDKTGRVLEIDCPWATQEMANNILASIQGYAYRPYEAQGAILDPAAELGDGITVGGLYSQIVGLDATFNSLYLSNVSAPADEEVDHEYPYISPMERKLARKVTLGKDYFGVRVSKASGLEITKTDVNGNKKSRAIFNSDTIAMYNDDGSEALYFDVNAGKFKFAGDVAVTGGTMNINNNFVVDEQGNVWMNGNVNLSDGNITWGNYGPTKSQFSPDGVNDWSDTQRETDVYRRDWDYSKNDWGIPYQFVGKDGQNGAPGSDASVPSYITETYIDSVQIRSPNIIGGQLNINNNFLVDTSGNLTLNGNVDLSGGHITWGNSSPVQYQFSVDGSTDWHSTMTDEDMYRRDSLDGGVTWGAAYQFRGKDGQDGEDGSDASVPGYIRSTYIDATRVESFYIKGNRLEAQIPMGFEQTSDTDLGFILSAYSGSTLYEYMQIYAFDNGAGDGVPTTVFRSPCGGYAKWAFDVSYFEGNVDFSDANVSGLYLTFS